jgi:hypothetical protein
MSSIYVPCIYAICHQAMKDKPIKHASFWERMFHFKHDYIKHKGLFMGGYLKGWLVVGQTYKCRICGHQKTEFKPLTP